MDTNGNVLEGATVTLTAVSDPNVRTVTSGSGGQFDFSALPPDGYRLAVTAPGMIAFTSERIVLAAGQAFLQPAIHLAVAGATTSITVSGSSQQLSIEQEQIAIQQRVLGVFPNFYTTYEWNAPPMMAKQKLQLSLRSVFDPVSLLAVAAVAGAEQYKNTFSDYGGGFEGYGKRYGAALTNHVSADMLGEGIFPALFHQDPRYFYKGTGSFRTRALYAMSSSFIARGDNGRWEPNYSDILGNFSAAALSNLYYPASNRGVSLVVFNGLANMGADSGAALVREFILKRFTTHAPKSAAGQGAVLNLH